MSDQFNPYDNNMQQNPYGQQANPYAQPQADPYGQQANPYAQPQVDPYAQQNPYAQPQADPYGQNPYNQPQFGGGYPGGAAPQKSGNGKKIAIIVGIIAALAAVAVVLILFVFKKDKDGGKDSSGTTPKDLAVAFVEAFEDFDTNKIASLFPPELAADSEVEQIKQMFSMYESMGVTMKFKNTKYDVGEEYSDSDLDMLKSTLENQGYNISDKIKVAKNVKITCQLETSYAGETNSQDYTASLVVGKVNGEWKILGLLQ